MALIEEYLGSNEVQLPDGTVGKLDLWYTYNDQTMQVERLRSSNTSGRPYDVVFTRTNGQSRTIRIGAAEALERSLPNNTMTMQPDPNEPGVVTFNGSVGFSTVAAARI